MKSRTIAQVSVCSALAVIFSLAAYYLPSHIAPLGLSALATCFCFRRTGWIGGLICALSTVAITFAVTSISTSFIFYLVIFFPYSVISHLIRALDYSSLRRFFVRMPIMLAFFFGEGMLMLTAFSFLTATSYSVFSATAGIWLAAAVFALLGFGADFFITHAVNILDEKIK